MRKKSTLIKISSVWCLLKLDRPVYYHRFLNLINTTLDSIFFFKKVEFCILLKKLRIERNIYQNTAKHLPIKTQTYRLKIVSILIELDQKKMSLKSDQLEILLGVYRLSLVRQSSS